MAALGPGRGCSWQNGGSLSIRTGRTVVPVLAPPPTSYVAVSDFFDASDPLSPLEQGDIYSYGLENILMIWRLSH